MGKKQNQIEEMERNCKDCIHYEICSLWTTTDLDEDEAYRYCFGNYRPKVSKNAVVLTREEFEKFKKQDLFMKDYTIVEVLENETKKARKETAEKIMNDISSDIIVINTKEYGNIEVIPVERLQEICNNMIEGK